jgi:hypothetical protein
LAIIVNLRERHYRVRPGAQVTSPRPREPHPLRRPVSPADVLRARDSVQSVT